ncbi:MAG: hypothetical protein PHT59_00450 [Candidatus Omnitrophica bacterium]|nr:hypothetical protein [Candidatus Omnitrophota bacterium]
MRILVLVSVIVALSLSPAYAHAPGPVSVKVADGVVEIFAAHSVSDPTTHYVKLIIVRVNGEEAGKKEFSSQPGTDGQPAKFEIEGLKAGDEVEVYAACSRFGDTTKKVTVE